MCICVSMHVQGHVYVCVYGCVCADLCVCVRRVCAFLCPCVRVCAYFHPQELDHHRDAQNTLQTTAGRGASDGRAQLQNTGAGTGPSVWDAQLFVTCSCTQAALNNPATYQIRPSPGDTTLNPPEGVTRPDQNSEGCPGRSGIGQSRGTAPCSSGSREEPTEGPAGKARASWFSHPAPLAGCTQTPSLMPSSASLVQPGSI